MVMLIEDQMHQFLVDAEEVRCRKLEESETGASKKAVVRRKIGKPWVRPSAQALCHDIETIYLLMVSEFDYELANEDFQRYCSQRGVLHVAGESNSIRWEYMKNHKRTKAEYLANPFFQYAAGTSKEKYKYSPEEMETGWKIIQIGRAKLQDCWELFCQAKISK